MIIDLNESQIRSLDRVRAILDGAHTLDFAPAASPGECCEWVASVLRRFRYNQLRRPHGGLVLRYLRRFSGFSRTHMTRLVQRWMLGHRLERVKGVPANAFARRDTDEDVFTLAETEREYGRLSGPAMVAVLRWMYQVYIDERFERLQYLSASHLYNLRRSQAYRLHHMVYTKTRANHKGAAIAVRRAPVPENRPGFIQRSSGQHAYLGGLCTSRTVVREHSFRQVMNNRDGVVNALRIGRVAANSRH